MAVSTKYDWVSLSYLMISKPFLSFFSSCNLYEHMLWRNEYLFIDYQNVIYSHINYFTAGSEKTSEINDITKHSLAFYFIF